MDEALDKQRTAAAVDRVGIEIEDFAFCPRYSALFFENVTVQPSPPWLQHRLEAIGLNAINNIVDVTNFVMAELGLSEFCLPAKTFEVDQLIERFTELQSRSAELTQTMAGRNAEKARLLDRQFAELSRLLFPVREPAQNSAEPAPARPVIR